MKRLLATFTALLLPPAALFAAENGAMALMDAHSKAGAPSDIRYHGQPAQDGVLKLTASNGFFDRCFQAVELQAGAASDPFIGAAFGALAWMSDEVRGTARWHLWCAEAGKMHATTYHFRLFVTHDEGKSWAYESGTFKTND